MKKYQIAYIEIMHSTGHIRVSAVWSYGEIREEKEHGQGTGNPHFKRR